MKAAQFIYLEKSKLIPRPIIFDGFSEKANYNFHRQVCSTLMRGLKTGKEHGTVLFAESGEPAYCVVQGGDTGVRLPKVIMKWLAVARPRSLALIHNHPSSGSFSFDDLNLFFSYPAWYLWLVVAHDGTVYYLKKQKNIKKYDADFILMDFAANLDFLHIKYDRAVQTGAYSEEAASAEHTHEAVRLIQKEYNFVYDRVKRDNGNKKKPFEVPEAPRMPFKHENYPKLLAMWSNEASSNAKYYDLFIEGFYDEESDIESEEDEKRVLRKKSVYSTSNTVLVAGKR